MLNILKVPVGVESEDIAYLVSLVFPSLENQAFSIPQPSCINSTVGQAWLSLALGLSLVIRHGFHLPKHLIFKTQSVQGCFWLNTYVEHWVVHFLELKGEPWAAGGLNYFVSRACLKMGLGLEHYLTIYVQSYWKDWLFLKLEPINIFLLKFYFDFSVSM